MPSRTCWVTPFGKFGKWCRYKVCRHIFKSCGENVNIERGAYFGTGQGVCIGNNSGIGINAVVPNDIVIGNNVMMGPDVIIFSRNHNTARTDIPMGQQGDSPARQTVIEDDVWIGQRVMMTPGRHVKQGTIVAAGCVLCKDSPPPYAIIGGNPSALIKIRE